MKCPFCGRDLPLHIALAESLYKDKPQAPKPLLAIKDVEAMLEPDLAKLCEIAIHDEATIHIKPRKYLGKENFWKLAKAVKALNGNYVSKGKESYLWIPRKQPS